MYCLMNRILSASSSETLSDATDSVTKFASAIDEYGPLVVILAVFLVIFLLLVFLMLRSNAKLMEHVLSGKSKNDSFEEELLAKFVDNALDQKMKNINNNNIEDKVANEVAEAVKPLKQAIEAIGAVQDVEDAVHKDLVGAYIDVNTMFKGATQLAAQSLSCDRVAIYVFHNGNKSMHGLPFFKMSCIHEWNNNGCKTLRGKSHTDLPLHLFADFVEELWKNGVYKSENVSKSVTNDNSLNEFIMYSKTKSLYLIAIKDENNIISGFVAAEFEKEDTFESDCNRDSEVRKILDDMIIKVSPIVSHYHISKK